MADRPNPSGSSADTGLFGWAAITVSAAALALALLFARGEAAERDVTVADVEACTP